MITEKEQKIFDLLATGLSKGQISQNLGIPERTVERCLTKLRGKKGALSNSHLYSLSAYWMMAGELMDTLQNVLTYCPNVEIKRSAAKRLEELKEKYNK